MARDARPDMAARRPPLWQLSRGKVIAKAVTAVDGYHLTKVIKKHVTPKSTIYTDEFGAYNSVRYLRGDDGVPLQYRHRRIRHAGGVYVKGDIHTNTVEGLWSLIKNGIRGVYHNVSPEYLQSYLDEYTFRYNRRFDGNQQFNAILERACERAS